MKSEDLLTDAELRSMMTESAASMREQAEADASALAVDQETYETDLEAAAAAEVVAAQPAMAGIEQRGGLDDGALTNGQTQYEQAFARAQQDALSAVASGVDRFVAMVLQEAVNIVDELRELADEMAAESGQLALAASTGLLTPPSATDIEDYQDEVSEAKAQATLVQRETQNLRARRLASRVAEGTKLQPDEFPIAQSLPGRPLVRTESASEPTDRDDQGSSLVQGNAGQTRSSVASDQNIKLQALLRKPAIDRIAYIAVCSAIANMSRAQSAQARAKKTLEKLKSVYEAIENILSGRFLNDLQENLEAQAGKAIGKAVDFLQQKLDAADGFLQAIARLPGPFLSTVQTIGDEPDRAPVIDSLSALCGLKGERFCDLQGLIEVAISLDVEFGLQAPRLPMFGRAQLTLDPPEESQAPHHVVVPGQEADLILVSVSGTTLVARFSRQLSPTSFDGGTRTFRERPDVFGNGAGRVVLIGNGTQEDVEFTYTAVSFSALTNNYTFTLTSAPGPRVPTVRGEADTAALPSLTGPAPGALPTSPLKSWNASVAFPVGASVITMRVPEAQARDISLPCDLALGFGEQILITGEYDSSVPNQIQALSGAPFASWMVGLSIDIGSATSTAQAQRRTITTFIDAETLTYSGANIPGTLNGGTRGLFRLTIDSFEVRRALSVVDGPHPDLKSFTLNAATSRPHARLRALPQAAVRVVPDVRDTNLNQIATPADPNVRDRDILPAGSTVFSATYTDPAQDAYFTPILTAAVTGRAFIGGQGPFAYTLITDETGPTVRVTLAAGTPQAFAAGTIVEIETTSLLDRFSVEFPDSWFTPLDNWLLGLGAELNRLEAKFCRLLSGSPQDIAASAAALSALSSSVSLTLTTARFALVAWLVPLTQASSLTRALTTLEGMGATRAAQRLREGRVGEFVSMTPAEGSHEGNTLIVAQAYQDRVVTEEEYRVLAKSVAEVRARFDAQVAATNAVGDIKAAQAVELERRKQGARRIEALQEKLP